MLQVSVFQKSRYSDPLKRLILLRLYGLPSPVYMVYSGRLAEAFLLLKYPNLVETPLKESSSAK